VKILCTTQKTADWFTARTGRITASRIADVLNFLKPKKDQPAEEGSKRIAYRAELIAERLTAIPADHYVSKAMQFGTDYEDDARRAYELATETMVDQTGFVLHPAFDFAGCSPDGTIGTEGGLELKVPQTATHLSYLLADVVPEEYRPQMYFNMQCCELAWMDFASFDPRLPGPLKLFVKRLHYNEEQCEAIDAEVMRFHQSIEASIAYLKERFGDFKLPEAQEQRQDTEGMIDDEDIAAAERAWQQ
jgi:hypothetical protein